MFPFVYDLLLTPCEWLCLGCWRAAVVGPATGRVLEIGAGTGRNIPYYRDPAELVLSDPDPLMLARARGRAATASHSIHLVAADAEQLPFPAAHFDVVVATLVFCTIPHPERAFAEIRRVLKSGGTVRMLEHVRASRPCCARLQDTLTPAWRRLAHGCHLNRSTLKVAQSCGFAPMTVRFGLDGWLLAAELRVSAQARP